MKPQPWTGNKTCVFSKAFLNLNDCSLCSYQLSCHAEVEEFCIVCCGNITALRLRHCNGTNKMKNSSALSSLRISLAFIHFQLPSCIGCWHSSHFICLTEVGSTAQSSTTLTSKYSELERTVVFPKVSHEPLDPFDKCSSNQMAKFDPPPTAIQS